MCALSKYPKNDAEEMEAIVTFLALIDKKRVKPDIKYRDKQPHVDGTIELVDSNSFPQGKLDVQVRKVPAGAHSYSCPVSLYDYSKVSSLPVLLIASDPTEHRVMWSHIRVGMPEFKANQDSFTIKFSEKDEVNKTGLYLERWQAIASDYIQRIQEYPELAARVASEVEPEGVPKEVFAYFQEYVGELNSLLDRDFQVIKERMLPRAWKIGIGIAGMTERRVQYRHHRLELGSKQPLVSRLENGLSVGDLSDPSVLQVGMANRSALKSPREQALAFLERPIQTAMDQYKFVIHGAEIAQNTLVQYVNLYPQCFGLPRKEEYKLSELLQAFYVNFPKACHRYCPFQNDPSSEGVGYIDLDRMEPSLKHSPEINLGPSLSCTSFKVESMYASIGTFEGALRFAISNGINIVRNPWEPMGERSSSCIWGFHDKERVRENIRKLLQKLIPNYSQFVGGNQLALSNSPYLSPSITIVYRWEERNGDGFKSCPILHEYHVSNPDMLLPKQIILVGEEAAIDPYDKTTFTLNLNGKSWKVESAGWSAADWPFQKFPYLRGIYKMLATDLSIKYGYQLHTP